MNSFKTPKGTELPLLILQGKPYLQVAYRLVWFREEHPHATIETKVIELNDKFTVFKAIICDESGRILATAHKREDVSHFKDNLEKSETGAIGRALALCGYGTQFAPELDEAERLADSPIEPAKRPPLPYKPATDNGPIPPVEWEEEALSEFPAVEESALGNKEFKDGKHKGLTFSGFVKKDLHGAVGYAKFLEKLMKDGKHLTVEKKSFLNYAHNSGLFNIEIKNDSR